MLRRFSKTCILIVLRYDLLFKFSCSSNGEEKYRRKNERESFNADNLCCTMKTKFLKVFIYMINLPCKTNQFTCPKTS